MMVTVGPAARPGLDDPSGYVFGNCFYHVITVTGPARPLPGPAAALRGPPPMAALRDWQAARLRPAGGRPAQSRPGDTLAPKRPSQLTSNVVLSRKPYNGTLAVAAALSLARGTARPDTDCQWQVTVTEALRAAAYRRHADHGSTKVTGMTRLPGR